MIKFAYEDIMHRTENYKIYQIVIDPKNALNLHVLGDFWFIERCGGDNIFLVEKGHNFSKEIELNQVNKK